MSASPIEYLGFISILSFSFFSSLHCIFMCAPLVCAKLGPNSHFKNKELWFYNLFRMLSYIMTGALLGLLGAGIHFIASPFSIALSIGIAVLLIIYAILQFLPQFAGKIPGVQGRMTKPLQKLVQKTGSLSLSAQSAVLGGITVFLPCMTLTPALAMAMATQSALTGGLFMFAFALGTLPAMILGPGISASIYKQIPKSLIKIATAGFLLVAAGITLWRALGH